MLRLPSDDLLELEYGCLVVASRDCKYAITKDLARFVCETRTGRHSWSLLAASRFYPSQRSMELNSLFPVAACLYPMRPSSLLEIHPLGRKMPSYLGWRLQMRF